jgi:hypothetical protein
VAGQPCVGVGDRGDGAGRRRFVPADQLRRRGKRRNARDRLHHPGGDPVDPRPGGRLHRRRRAARRGGDRHQAPPRHRGRSAGQGAGRRAVVPVHPGRVGRDGNCPTPATRSSGTSRPCTRPWVRVPVVTPRCASGTCASRTPT